MNTKEYLYGVDADVPDVPAEVTVRRIEILNEELAEELDKHYFVRDNTRVYDIAKAIDFWEKINDN